jgi:hypothetical protein
MILSIHRANNSVGIDRRILQVDCSALDPAIAVVHWSGPEGPAAFAAGAGAGWIEFVYDPHAGPYRPNQEITSARPYQAIIDAWRAQAQAIDNPVVVPPTWTDIRATRDALLAATDWIVAADAPAAAAARAAFLAYRQELRDVPQAFASPSVVVWPAPPIYAKAALKVPARG